MSSSENIASEDGVRKEAEDIRDDPTLNDNQNITIFHDPINYNVKHPLHNSWTLWFDNPGKKVNPSSWSANLKQLVTFDTVEDYWGVQNNIVKVSELAQSSNYHLFKLGIRPEWEDPANEHGGKWFIQLPRKSSEDINTLWLHTVLACIGETFLDEHEICGAVVSVRKSLYRISLWTRTSDNRETAEAVGRQLKAAMCLSPNQLLEFQAHSAEDPKNGPQKERWTV